MGLVNSPRSKEIPEVSGQKVPPHNLHAEESVLGSLLLRGDLLGLLTLQPDDFYAERHALIYAAIQGLGKVALPIDSISVAEALGEKQLERCGGLAYLSSLADRIPSLANIKYYAEIIEQKSALRALIWTSCDIAEGAYAEDLGPENTDAFLDGAEAKIQAIRDSRCSTGELYHVKDLTRSVFQQLEQRWNGSEDLSGVSTGLDELDKMLCGFHKKELILLGARPSMGKTSLALKFAQSVASNEKPVIVFSLEMGKEELLQRIACQMAGVNSLAFRDPKAYCTDANLERLIAISGDLVSLPIYIDDNVGLTPLSLRSQCRRFKSQMGDLGLVIVDYLQLMKADGPAKSRQEEVSEISRELKILAKDLDVPVVALCQLNRELERRNDKRPKLSDLRESGTLEQDADVIMFVYRDEVYDEDSPDKGIAEIIIGKQRSGPCGTAQSRFTPHTTEFSNLVEADKAW